MAKLDACVEEEVKAAEADMEHIRRERALRRRGETDQDWRRDSAVAACARTWQTCFFTKPSVGFFPRVQIVKNPENRVALQDA
ncbi:hypothetical protein [Burkholderia ubonensis]|uniref:hypothetical protein n=1 Tax=Burkholderia ubonensis TaxID=101571 RepID=UPI0012FC96A1|nr:hypothetical protein [Burkholderia ubonensis]